jgi:hypothetical protein
MASKEKKQPEKRDEPVKSELLQRFKAKPLLFIGTVTVLVIVIISFVFVPAIVPRAYGERDLVFGYYNGVPIKYVQNNYFHQVQQSMAQNQQISSDDPNYIFKVGQIWKGAFEETVIYMGIQDEMKKAGYVVPPDVVDREVAKLPHFQENGRFSSARYRAMDNTSRMNLWRQVYDSMAAKNYMSDISNLKASSKEAAFISSMASPRRSFDLAVFPLSSYPDSEVISFAAENPGLFKLVHLSRITVNSSERDAKQIHTSVTNGVSTFEEAAITNSQDWHAEKGGDMGLMMAFELISDIPDEQTREKIINLEKDSISDVVKVSSGWAFYRAGETARPADTNDPSQIEKIRNYILKNFRGRIEDWVIAEAGKFVALANEKGFSAASAESNTEKRSFGPIPVNYGNSPIFPSLSASGIPELAAAGANEFFWKLAFGTPLNSVSKPLVVHDHVVVLEPLEESPAEESEISNIENFFPYWISSGTQYAYRTHFLTSDKLDDRFEDTFWGLWGEF